MNIFKIFKKKEYNWVDIKFAIRLAHNRGIAISHHFKYCTINDELLKFTIPDRGFEKANLKESIKKFPQLREKINELTIDKRRDILIDKLLKNNNN